MRSAATSPVVTASHSMTVSNGALAVQWLEFGPVTRTSSRCAMNVARFSSRCQKPYTSCGGLLMVVVEVSSMGVLLRGGWASVSSQARRQGDLRRQDDPLRLPDRIPRVGIGMSADTDRHAPPDVIETPARIRSGGMHPRRGSQREGSGL